MADSIFITEWSNQVTNLNESFSKAYFSMIPTKELLFTRTVYESNSPKRADASSGIAEFIADQIDLLYSWFCLYLFFFFFYVASVVFVFIILF